MKTPFKSIVVLISSLALVITTADAKPGKENGKNKGGGNAQSQNGRPGKGKAQAGKANKGNHGDKGSDSAKFARFKDNERNEVLDYFGRFQTQGDGLPPGLAMNQRRGKPLPPGWQKKLTPGYRINDDEWSSYDLVPAQWFPNLRMEPNTRLYHYGDRVVRVYEPRREVIDVITLPSR